MLLLDAHFHFRDTIKLNLANLFLKNVFYLTSGRCAVPVDSDLRGFHSLAERAEPE